CSPGSPIPSDTAPHPMRRSWGASRYSPRMDQPVRHPDLSSRPHELTVERVMKAAPSLLYATWTQGLDLWLAVPGSVRMRPLVGEPLYFDTGTADKGNPHYGRILTLEPDRRVVFTWVTAATEGVETVVDVEFRK